MKHVRKWQSKIFCSILTLSCRSNIKTMSNEEESTTAFDLSRLAESLKEEIGRLLDQKLEPMYECLGGLEESQSSMPW